MNKNCLSCILKVIDVIQNKAESCDNNNTCTRPILGTFTDNICYNTRLVTFYRCDNSLITLPYVLNDTNETTTIFRVQSVTDSSVLVLLVRDNGDGTYTNTNTFATINLGCVCAIRCIGDINLANV